MATALLPHLLAFAMVLALSTAALDIRYPSNQIFFFNISHSLIYKTLNNL
jgi:hypothetical protein